MLAKSVTGVTETRSPQWLAKSGASAVFVLLCWSSFLLHKEAVQGYMSLERDRANEYRAFVMGLRALPPPAKGETIFFDSYPSLFDEVPLRSATQVAFRRNDLSAKVVTEVLSEARFRLRFQESRPIQVPQ